MGLLGPLPPGLMEGFRSARRSIKSLTIPGRPPNFPRLPGGLVRACQNIDEVAAMRLATVLTPMSDENLQLAAQCGVTDVVHRYPGEDIAMLRAAKQRIAAFGMSLPSSKGICPSRTSNWAATTDGSWSC